MNGQGSSPESEPVGAVRIAVLACQTTLIVVFMAAGSAKLAGAEQMIEAFDEIGAGHWLRYLVGMLEVAGSVGLLVPRLSGVAALGLASLMIGAVITNIIISAFSILAVILLLLSAAVAWGRRDRLRALRFL
ncbi:DoxX family protein [Streptomyces tsukubensis]